jgi:hypothetical protein
MFYQINVSLHGQHFFETDINSIPNETTMEKMYKVFKEKFPQEEGYDMLVWDMDGKFVDTGHLDKEDEE